MQNQINHVRHFPILILAFICVITAVGLLLGHGGQVFAQTAAPSWTYTGNLNTGRVFHTATLLRNGKVLVTGGQGGADSAELYDPATGMWSVTGSLNTLRSSFHTATLLPNGKILVVGGLGEDDPDGGSVVNNTAELYDPATGAWTLTGNLNVARHGHTATLLPDGKVLVAGGGDTDCCITDSAELYDPTTGTWSLTGSLHTTRGEHTATLLSDGRVLVTGGTDGFFPSLHSSELYDPNTGTWSVTGDLNTDRVLFTATLLGDGKVLAVGGESHQCSFRGCGFSGVTNTAELYNPATGTWSYTGNLSYRAYHTATLLPNGQVAVAGGVTSGFGGINSAEIYDPTSGNWSSTASLNTSRSFHTATLLSNGEVLIAGGGSSNSNALSSTELYDSGTTSTPNPIDDSQFFVRQQYRDFLNREPDADGLTFWTSQVASCGSDPQCVETQRINVSAAFFLSIEFQQTGYLVYRTWKAAYGDPPDEPVPIRFDEFLPDTKQISNGVVVNQAGWESVLENNKQAFTSEFVQRPRFATAYPNYMTPDQFVDALFGNAGVTPSENDRTAAINEFSGAFDTSDVAARVRALRRVAENDALTQQEFDRAFVLMQYFGYLRRDPNSAPDTDFSGYNFWLNKLKTFNGNFVQAEMVKAFIISAEYRQRFAQ